MVPAGRRPYLELPFLLLLLLLLLAQGTQAFLLSTTTATVPRPAPVRALATASSAHAPAVYRMTRLPPASPGDEATLTVALADGRTFVLRDACPPTNHSLLHAEVDPAILALQDPVFGTRFDLRTGRVRGAWCPDTWWARRLFPQRDLVVLSTTAQGGETDKEEETK